MKLPTYKAATEWVEVWEITEWKGGAVYRTRNTGFHAPAKAQLPHNVQGVSFSTAKLKQPEIDINPHPLFK